MRIKISFLLLFLINFSAIILAQDTLIFRTAENQYIPENDTVLIFTPESGSNVPAIIMLHGWSGNYKQWTELANLQQSADSLNMVLVCPDGLYDSWYLNSPAAPRLQMEDFIIKSLIPALVQKYNIDTSALFITGLSMGGHGAVSLFLKYPGIFKGAGSTSGVLDICLFPSKWGMEKVLGKYDANPEAWKRNSSFYLLEDYKSSDLRIIIDCGTEDFAYDVNKAFAERCRELKIPLKFISQPGNHSREYWSSSIYDHFRFFKDKSANR